MRRGGCQGWCEGVGGCKEGGWGGDARGGGCQGGGDDVRAVPGWGMLGMEMRVGGRGAKHKYM